MMEVLQTFLLLTPIGTDWSELAIDICVLIVLIATLFVTSAPVWGLGVIFWCWWRGGGSNSPSISGQRLHNRSLGEKARQNET
jgi:hypothetical protein